jgi:hypothetical protein
MTPQNDDFVIFNNLNDDIIDGDEGPDDPDNSPSRSQDVQPDDIHKVPPPITLSADALKKAARLPHPLG